MSTSTMKLWQGAMILVLLGMVVTGAQSATFTQNLTVQPSTNGDVILRFKAAPTVGAGVVYDVFRKVAVAPPGSFNDPADKVAQNVSNGAPTVVLINTNSQFTNGVFGTNTTSDAQPYYYQVRAQDVNGVGTRIAGTEVLSVIRGAVADVNEPADLRNNEPDFVAQSVDFVPSAIYNVLLPADSVLNADSPLQAGTIAQIADPSSEYRFQLVWRRKAQSTNLTTEAQVVPLPEASVEIRVPPFDTYDIGKTETVLDSSGMESGTEYNVFVQIQDTVGNRNGVSAGNLDEGHLEHVITAIAPVTLTPSVVIDGSGQECGVTVIEWLANPNSLTTDPANLNPARFRIYAASSTTPILDQVDLAGATLIGEVTAAAGVGGASTPFSFVHGPDNLYLPRLSQATYAYCIIAEDEFGRTGPLSDPVVMFASDTVPPSLCEIFDPVDGATVTGTIPVQANVLDNLCGGSGIDRTDFYITDATGVETFIASDDTDYPGATTPQVHAVSLDTTLYPMGYYVLSATTWDFGANPLGSTNNPTIFIDNTIPEVEIVSPAAGSYVNNVLILSGTAFDVSGITLVELSATTSVGTINGVVTGTNNWTATLDLSPVPSEEAITVTATATDGVGSTGASAALGLVTDSSGPEIDLFTCPEWISAASALAGITVSAGATDPDAVPAPAQAGVNDVTLSAAGADAPDTYVTGSPNTQTFTFSTVVPVEGNSLVFTAYADDNALDQRGIAAGVTANPCRPNIGPASTCEATFDLTGPICEITSPVNNYIETNPVPFNVIGEATDELSGLLNLWATIAEETNPLVVLGTASYSFPGAPNNAPFNFSIDPGMDGVFIITVTVYDQVGNSGVCTLRVIRDSLPPTAGVFDLPEDVCTSIVVCGTASDVFGTINGVTVVWNEYVAGVWSGTGEAAANVITGATNSVEWCVDPFIINAGLPDGATIEIAAYASTSNPDETGPLSATEVVTVDITPPVSAILGAAVVDGSATAGVDPTVLLYMCSSGMLVSGTAEDFGGAILGPPGVLGVNAFYQVATGPSTAFPAVYNNVTGNWSVVVSLAGVPSGSTFELGSQAQDAATSCQTLEALNILGATFVVDCVPPDIAAVTNWDGLCIPGSAFPLAFQVNLTEQPSPFHVGLSSAEFVLDGVVVDTDTSISGQSSATATGLIPLPPSGVHTISVIGYDMLGNANTLATQTFTVDADAPVVAFTAPPVYINTVNVQCTLGALMTDVGCGIVAATVTYTDLPSDTIVSVSPDVNGDVSLLAIVNPGFADGSIWQATLEAEDAAGNLATVVVRTFTVDTEPVGLALANLDTPDCVNGIVTSEVYVSDSSAFITAPSLGYADSGIRYATVSVVVNGATTLVALTGELDPPWTGAFLFGYPFDTSLLPLLGAVSGDTFQLYWEFEDGPCDVGNVAAIITAPQTWDVSPPDVAITHFVWPNGDRIETVTGGAYLISCASEPFDIIGSVTDDCSVAQVEIFYSPDTSNPGNDVSLGLATVDLADGTFMLTGVSVPPLLQGNGTLWAIATDGILPTSGTANVSERATEIAEHGISIFVDTIAPEIMFAAANPFAATSASQRSITLTMVVCDEGTGVDANAAIALTAAPKTVAAVDINKRVPPTGTSGTTLSKLAVPLVGTIGTISIDVNITHTYRGDLALYLTSPGGTVYQFKTSNGADGADDVIGSFDVTAGFAGEEAHGTWTLTINDVFFLDSGWLNSWSLTFTGAVTQVVTADPDYQAIDLGNPDPAPMAANFLATSATCATYTLTFNLPILLPTEGLLPLDIATADLGGCTVAATVTSVDGFVLMIDNTAPAPNLPDPDPLAVDPNNIDYPADDTIVQLLGAPGPFDWDYDDPATWTDNELTNPNGWDQHAFLNSAAVRLAASQPLVLAGKLLVSGQARDNSGVVQSGVQEVAMFWTYGSPNTPPPASAFTNQVPETKQNLTPMSNAAAPYSTFFNASSIVGTFYIKTRTTDYAGNVLDPIFGPFLGVDVMAPEAITWLRATVHRGSSDVLLDWHLGGHAPDNVVTVGYEIYRTKFAIQDLFGLTPADFDLIDVIDATSPINGQDVYTYLDTIPGAGVYGYYIVGFDAAGNGRAGSMIPGNPSNRVAAMKNDIVDPLPVNNLRVVGNQPLTTVRLSWSIPDNPLTLAPFDGDNVGIAQFKIYRKQQQVPLTDGDPDDLDGDLVPANLVGVVVNNYLPNKIVGERASLNGANTAELVVMSPPVAATAVTRVYNQRLGALYNVVSVVDRTITVSAGPGASLPAATDTVLVDYETFDRVFWDDAVSPGRHYAYAVIAQDAAENNSDISGLAEDSTGTALDTTPPEAITQLAVTGYVGNSTLTLEWPVTPYDNVAVMGYNILTSTAPIFDINNPGKDSRVLQLAGYPKVAYAAAATPSVVIDLLPGDVDFGTLVVTDLTNGATVPHQSEPGVNPAVDTYWTASLTGAVNTVTVYNIPAEALDVPVNDGSTYPANLSVAYFNANEILYDAGTNTFREQLGFSFDPTTYWGTNVCLENEILYFVVMAVDPSGNQAPISNIASAQVTPVPPLAPIAYIEEVSPAKRYLPGVWVGGEDIVFATLADPVRDWDVVAIEVYSEDPGQLSFVNSATAPNADGWYEIPVGDNLYPKLFVIAVDCAGNRSEATVLFNDIVAPPAPIVDRAVFNPAPIADLIYGFATVDTVQVHLYNDSALEDLVAVAIPSTTGAWNFVIPDITPEFVFVTALDAASNESKATVIDVLPDPPMVVTDPRVLEIPPLRTRFIVYAGVVVTTGGPDRVQGTVSDPDVKRVNVYSDEALVQLEFSGIPSATGWFDIPIGDNYLPVCWVVAVDSAGHRSAAVRLLNDIVAPPAPIISEIIFNATPTPDIIRGFVSLDTVTVNVYNDFPLYELIGSFAVVPGPNGAFEISIADITPEFVFTAALDSVSNESSPYISPVIPDAPVIATFPTVRQNPPIRFRCGALEGDNDYVIGYTNDPQVVKIEVYRDADLDWPGDLIATQVLAGTNYFNISIGDNLYPEVFVVAVDSQNHRSPAVRLTNDIVPPPVLEGITLELYEGNNPDYIPPRPDIVRGFSTPDTTLVSLYKDPELTECIGEAVPANGQWSITATEDILFDFVFVSVHDDTVDGDGLRHHPSNESDDLSDETVPAERRAKRIRVPNSPPIVYSVEVTENLPGNQDTVKVTTQRGADPGWDPDTEVEVRVFSVMREGAPNVVTPFATLISDVRDIDTDLASNVYLAVDAQVLQLTQDGHTRVFFQAAGVNPRTLFFDHRYTGRLLLGGGDGQIRVVNVSGFVPGTPLGAGAVLASLNTGIAGDDLVGPVVDTANSSAAGLRLVYASRASGDIMQVDFNAVGNSFGAPSVRHAAGATGINSPQSLAFNLAGDLFVGDVVAGGGMANPGKDRVVRVRAANGRTTVMAKNLTLPSGMSIDVAGDLYINQLTPRNIGLRGEVVVYRPFETEVGATLLRSIHTTFEGQPLRPSVDPAGRMYFGSRTGANVSYVYQGVLSARFPWGPDSGSDGVPDAWGVPITPVQSPQSQTAPDGQITFNIGDNEHAQIAVIAVRRGGFSTGVPVLASNDIVEPQPPVAQVADATPPLQDSVTGYAERKSTVVVYGDPFGTNDLRSYNVGDSGAFIQLFLGNNYLPAYWIAAIDRAGNRSVLHQLETDIEIDVPRLDKLTVICNPPGQNDLVRGDPAAVEGWAWVRIYSNPELTHLVNSPVQAGADGSFLYNIGDNQVSDMWLIAVDVNGNVSRPVRLWNDTEGPSLNPAAIQVLAHEQGAQDFVIGLAGAVEAGATVQAWLDAGLTMPAPDPIAVAGLDGAFGTLNMGDDSSPIIEMTGTAPFQTPRRSFFLRAKDACGNPGPVLELDNPFVAGDSPVDIDKIIVHSRETLLTDSVEGIYGAVEPFATVQVYYDVFFTQPVMVGAVHAATSADQWGQFGPIDLGDDLAAAFFLKVTDAYGNVSAPVKIYNPFVPGISEVDPSRIIVFSNQNGIDDFVIGIAGAVEPRAAVAIFYDAAFSNPVPGAVATADDHGAFGPISLGNDLATQFYLRAIDEIGHISSPYLLLNPYVENPVDVNPSLIEVTSNEELVDDWILGKSGAVEPRGRVLIFKTIGDATAIAEDPVTHVVLESVPGVVARAFRSTTANDFGGFGPVNVGDDESDVFYLRVIDETNHISSPLLLRNPLVPGVVDVDPFRIRVVANQEGLDDYIVGDSGAVEPFSGVEVFTSDWSIAPATPVRTGSVDQYGRFTINIGDDEFRVGDELETEFWLRFTDPIGHLSAPYRVVNPFILGTQRPDVMRIRVISNPEGQDDLVVGVDGAVEANAEVRIYSDAGLTHLVAVTQADMWGAFGPVSVGDDVSTVFYLVAIDNLGNQSSPLRLLNPFVPNNPQATSFGFVVLDGFGGVHTRNVYDSLSNAAHQNVGVPYPLPIFSAIAPVLDGFFVLRGDGVIEALGNAPLVDQVSMPNYPMLFTGDFTRGVDIQAYEDSSGGARGMYVVDAYGEVFTSRVYGVEYVRSLSEPPLYYDRVVRAMQLVRDEYGDPVGTLVMDRNGMITARGGGAFSDAVSAALGQHLMHGMAVAFDVKTDANHTVTGLLVLGENGDVVAVGDAPDVATRPAIAGGLARDIEIDPTGRGYYILDGLGGILTVGDITPLEGAPYFGFDIARDLDVVHARGGRDIDMPPYPYPEEAGQ